MKAGTNRRRTAGNVLIGLVSAVLVISSVTKFVGVAPVIAQLAGFGFTRSWITLIGLIELASGMALILRRTRALGVLLVSGFFGGAIATHIQHGELPIPPALLLALCWLGVWLRHQAAFRSFTDENAGAALSNGRTSGTERFPALNVRAAS
jgi:DoxX-like family